MQKLYALEMQVLGHAQPESVGHIEPRWTFLRMRIVRILRET